MKVLFIGGTGVISSACTQSAVDQGIDLWLLHRGTPPKLPTPPEVGHITADIRLNPDGAASLLSQHTFDAVVDWVAYTPNDVQNDIRIFAGKTSHFIFISSASVYQRPVHHYLVTEGTPLANPFWDYAQSKIACEEELMKSFRSLAFPVTIVRPSLTYGPTHFPLCVYSKEYPYTIADRIRSGKKIIIPGDGTSLWTVTYNADFAKGLLGLLGYSPSIGHSFHITSDEVLTWDQIYLELGRALGVEPKLIHLPSDLIASQDPQRRGSLLGDKSWSVVFDNSKIKRFVPSFQATTSWSQGVKIILEWFHADPSRCTVDIAMNARWDSLIAAYEMMLQKISTE